MKVTTTLTALAIGLASMGLAQAAETAPAANAQAEIVSSAGHDPYYPNLVAQHSAARAQVVQELQQAEANGDLASVSHDAYYPQMAQTQAKSRTQVVQELQQAEANGDLASVGHDAYYPSHPAA